METDWTVRMQAGVISHTQAVESGLSDQAVRRRVRAGQWRRLQPRVYLAAGHRLSDEARLRAAVLWAGEDAVASGPAAAWWHGLLADLPVVVDLTMPRGRRLTTPSGIAVRRRDLPGADVVSIRDVGTTALPLTVLEAAVALPDGAAVLDRALQRRVRFAEVHRAHCRNIGRHGSPAAGRLLAAAADRSASEAERRLAQLMTAAGIRGWVRNHRVGPFALDFAFPAAAVAVEVDGWAWHVTVDRFRSDRSRQNALVLAGWTILRFTWHDLTQRPDAVVTEVRAALDRASCAPA